MALSLQIKKFINSERTGSYATVMLPVPEEPDKHKDKTDEQEAAPAEPAATPLQEAKIHYFEAGNGEPLLLLHSIGQSAYTWRNVFDDLAQHYRVIAPDLLGHGYSDRPVDFFYSIEEQAEALYLFLQSLRIESTHIMAFGMAGLYALQLCRTHPEMVGKLMLLTPGGITNAMPSSVRMLDNPLFGRLASHLYNYKTVYKVLQNALFDLTVINDEVGGEYYKTICDPASRRAISMSVLNFDEDVVAKDLRDISHEVLIVWGVEDKWRPSEDMELYHASLANAQFCLIRNAGHLIQEEKPDRLLQVTAEFIPYLTEE